MLLNVLRKLPVSRLFLPYLTGILLLKGDLRFILSLLMLGWWGLLLYRLFEKRLPTAWSVRWLPGVCIFCLWMALGGINGRLLNEKASFPDEANAFLAHVQVVSLPVEKPKSKQCEIAIEKTEVRFNGWRGKHLQLYTQKNAAFGLGDHLQIKLKPKRPELPTNPFDFDFASWLRHKGICGTTYAKDWILVKKASNWNIKAMAERMRQLLLERFSKAGIEGGEFALVSALVLGETNQLTVETKTAFSVSGISHILSVSGLHVAVVYAILAFMLSFLNRLDRWRIPKQVLIILILFFYAFLTGFSPSVIRSAFMFSLLALGKCLHRKSQTLNTVLFSAFVLLLWNPSYLYDLGFQLSYLAVFFIVVVHPKLVAVWTPSVKATRYLWEMLCLSFVAQVGTSPLTIYAFHSFPNYFLVNNLIAVPFSSLIIYVALAFLLLSGLPWLGTLFAWLLETCLHGFLVMVETTGSLPHATTGNLYPNLWQVLGFYLILLTFFIAFLLKRRTWVIPFLVSILCFQFLAIGRSFWW
ncbi:MAG TPA: ComEC/Rec2 family competence protein [Bacteroidales bacterium]|nr:ComEC/Rec2 family competence protein [Bacteroidales bacterium]